MAGIMVDQELHFVSVDYCHEIDDNHLENEYTEMAGIVVDQELHVASVDYCREIDNNYLENEDTEITGIVVDEELHFVSIDYCREIDDNYLPSSVNAEDEHTKPGVDTKPLKEMDEPNTDSPCPSIAIKDSVDVEEDARMEEYISNPKDRKAFENLFDSFPHKHEKLRNWVDETQETIAQSCKDIQQLETLIETEQCKTYKLKIWVATMDEKVEKGNLLGLFQDDAELNGEGPRYADVPHPAMKTNPYVEVTNRGHERRYLSDKRWLRPETHQNVRNMENEFVFLNAEENVKKGTKDALSEFEGTRMIYSPVIWVEDTGATCHIINSDEATVPTRKADTRRGGSMNDSLDASGNKMRHTALVDIKGSVYSKGKRTLFFKKSADLVPPNSTFAR